MRRPDHVDYFTSPGGTEHTVRCRCCAGVDRIEVNSVNQILLLNVTMFNFYEQHENCDIDLFVENSPAFTEYKYKPSKPRIYVYRGRPDARDIWDVRGRAPEEDKVEFVTRVMAAEDRAPPGMFCKKCGGFKAHYPDCPTRFTCNRYNPGTENMGGSDY